MIYLRAIEYTAADREFVDNFQSILPLSHTYWETSEVKPIKSRIKTHYLRAQGYNCCYCRREIAITHARVWDAEHIVPRFTHPSFMFTPQNLALSCPDCNGPKTTKQTLVDPTTTTYPSTSDDFFIVHPHFDSYEAHIERGKYTYAQRSTKGAWTITNCNLTRFAGMEIGWPDPIADERYEEQMDEVFQGSTAAASSIGTQVRGALEETVAGKIEA